MCPGDTQRINRHFVLVVMDLSVKRMVDIVANLLLEGVRKEPFCFLHLLS